MLFRSRKAFLLLELILATVLISVALLGLLGGFRVALEAYHSTNRRARLLVLLESKLGELAEQGHFVNGITTGRAEPPATFQWTIETGKTNCSSLFRVKITVADGDESLSVVTYLREKAARGANISLVQIPGRDNPG